MDADHDDTMASDDGETMDAEQLWIMTAPRIIPEMQPTVRKPLIQKADENEIDPLVKPNPTIAMLKADSEENKLDMYSSNNNEAW